MLTKEEKQKLLEEKEKNHYEINKLNKKLNELNEKVFEIDKTLEEEVGYKIEQCNIILQDVARYCTYIETCIYADESTNIPIIKEEYYTHCLPVVLKNGKHIMLQKCHFSLLIQIDNNKANIYIENSIGEVLGKIKEISYTMEDERSEEINHE